MSIAKWASEKLSEASTDYEVLQEKILEECEQGSLADGYIDFLYNHAVNENGKKMRMAPWIEEYNRLICDLRIDTVTTGICQYGKSMFHFLMVFYLNRYLNLNTLFTFVKASIRNKIVGGTVQPLFEENCKKLPYDEKLTVDNNQLKRGGKWSSYWSFVNTNQNAEEVSVPAEIASITIDVAIMDEYSHYDKRIAAVIPRRQDNSEFYMKPQRKVGTPGAGAGIEVEVEKSDYNFYPHCFCHSCGELKSLHPEGALLKAIKVTLPNGREKDSFVDILGRPGDWHHHDPENPIESAYFGCPTCGTEFDKAERENARLYDTKTMMSVDQFTDMVNAKPTKKRTVAIHVSPSVKKSKINYAEVLIRDGLDTDNPDDWYQQQLGLPTSNSLNKISVAALKESMLAAPFIRTSPGWKVIKMLGMDQGRGSHYGTVVDMIIPNGGKPKDRYQNTIREVCGYYEVAQTQLSTLYSQHPWKFGAIDIYPETQAGVEIGNEWNLQLCAQKAIKDTTREEDVLHGGEKIKVNFIDANYFCSSVVYNFYRESDFDGGLITRLPSILMKDLGNMKANSFVRHLTSVSFSHGKAKWMKPDDGFDDFFFSSMFAEAALFLYITKYRNTAASLKYFKPSRRR